MRILKFGGTSLGQAHGLETACSLIQAASNASSTGLIVVASAFSGVTDALASRATASAWTKFPSNETEAFLNALRNRHLAAALPAEPTEFATEIDHHLADLERELAALSSMEKVPPRSRDAVLATGERLSVATLSARLRALGLNARGCDATKLIQAKSGGVSRGGEISVDPHITRQRIVDQLGTLEVGEVVVITGFIARGPKGETLTLGRGASDYTATLLASALDADAVEIWTDVSGVLSACPGLVPEAEPLSTLSYEEAAEMASLGARVLHPRTLSPVARRGIPVVVRNTLRPTDPGTLIESRATLEDQILAVTSIEEVCELELNLTQEAQEKASPRRGLSSRVFEVLDRLQTRPISVHLSVSGEGLAWTLRAEEADRAECELRRELAVELAAGGRLERRDSSSIIALVGGSKTEPMQLAGDLIHSLQQGGVQVRNFALPWQAADEYQARTALAVIDRQDLRPSAQLLHKALLAHRAASPETVRRT